MSWYNNGATKMPGLGGMAMETNTVDIGLLFNVNPPHAVAVLVNKWITEQKPDFPDPGTLNPSTWQGQAQLEEAQHHIDLGKAAFDRGEPKECIKRTNNAIKLAEQMIRSQELISMLYCNRATAYLDLKDCNAAFNDAVTAMRHNPVYLKGHFVMIDALTGKQKYDDAFNICPVVMKKYETTLDCYAVILKKWVSLASKVKDGFAQIEQFDYNLHVPEINLIWVEVLSLLVADKSWETIKILLFGTDDLAAIVTSCDAKDVKLSGLVDFCDITPWKQWGQKLCLYLLRCGANYKTLCPESCNPLHVALKVALKTDTFELLKTLLAKYAKTNEINQKNSDGNTLLHVACGGKSGSKTTAVKLLLSHNADVMIKNRTRLMAISLLSDDDPDRILLEQTEDVKSTVQATPGQSLLTTASVPDPMTSLIASNQIGAGDAQQNIGRDWSKSRVQKWLDECGIGQYKKKFRDIDGPMLCELRILQDQSPDTFYTILETEIQLPLMDICRLSAYLREFTV